MNQNASSDAKDATSFTSQRNREVLATLDFSDKQDFADARRGFIASLPEPVIGHESGRVVYSLTDYGFLAEEQAPASVNPSLWRIARLNMQHGLFKVTERVFQVRGYDIANMTIVEGDRGLIILDTTTTTETAQAALALYFEHRPRKSIVAVIYSHTHSDHHGGVRGIVDEQDVKAGRVAIVAPDLFMEEVTSEAVIAGRAMGRRAQFQFGPTLQKGPLGQVDSGVGKVSARGTVTLIPPTRFIREKKNLTSSMGSKSSLICRRTPKRRPI